MEENDDVVGREEVMRELGKGHRVRFLLHNCAGPVSPKELLWSQACEGDDNACSVFILLFRHIKCEFQRVTHFRIPCALTVSSRAHSNISIGKEVLCISKDLIPLT